MVGILWQIKVDNIYIPSCKFMRKSFFELFCWLHYLGTGLKKNAQGTVYYVVWYIYKTHIALEFINCCANNKTNINILKALLHINGFKCKITYSIFYSLIDIMKIQKNICYGYLKFVVLIEHLEDFWTCEKGTKLHS